MGSIPPTPPLKSIQRPSGTQRLASTATIRAVTDPTDPVFLSGPSMRTSSRPSHPPAELNWPIQDTPYSPALDTATTLGRADTTGSNRPILDRGRPKIGPPPLSPHHSPPQRHDSTRSPTRRGDRSPRRHDSPRRNAGQPVDIDWDNGVSYIDATGPTPRIWPPRRDSFGNGKPRGLGFHEARKFMRSGQGVRAGEWIENAPSLPAPSSTHIPAPAAVVYNPRHRERPRRSRSRSPRQRRTRSYSPERRDVDRNVSSHIPATEPTPQIPGYLYERSPIVLDDIALSPVQSNGTSFGRRIGRRRHVGQGWRGVRAHLAVAMGEFLGTMAFLVSGFGVLVAASGGGGGGGMAQMLVVSFGFAGAYAVNLWIFGRVSEGMFNPAVSTLFLHINTV